MFSNIVTALFNTAVVIFCQTVYAAKVKLLCLLFQPGWNICNISEMGQDRTKVTIDN